MLLKAEYRYYYGKGVLVNGGYRFFCGENMLIKADYSFSDGKSMVVKVGYRSFCGKNMLVLHTEISAYEGSLGANKMI